MELFSSETELGLYISKNTIESHGSRIWTENNSDGKGATFKFTLPFLGLNNLVKY